MSDQPDLTKIINKQNDSGEFIEGEKKYKYYARKYIRRNGEVTLYKIKIEVPEKKKVKKEKDGEDINNYSYLLKCIVKDLTEDQCRIILKNLGELTYPGTDINYTQQ